MNKLKKTLALCLAAFVVSSAMYLPVFAQGEEDGEGNFAGIDFKKGDIVIVPGPDEELAGIKSADIYFGEQKLSAVTEKYNSITSHTQTQLQHAGFIVSAGNTDGWEVTVQISGFTMNNNPTMRQFELTLAPTGLETTAGNQGTEPVPYEVTLAAGADGDLGSSARIFYAEAGDGFGKWGCNWAGDLTIIGGSVTEEGNARATMLWTLNPANVRV